ncbi:MULTISPECIES: DNA-binding protein [unclassified Agrobacterium]|uniref:DNA-binding protein n=1 Tax=unclassified Agrobacterium TaxID=2632611 RepID=UPI00083DE482|nr:MULTISPECIES: DNA-binding protein [unclassified Agrobacterium]AOG12755.1 AAA domain protein [Agrobacterium sp. RAC06]QGG93446.1 DNA-binding protein [Agrobacterium sp. MA01]
MKISAIRLFNVKRFAGRGVAIEGIGDGVNVLCAANEFGKSTSFEALHALFFQPHSGTPGDVQKLRPYSGGNPLVEADITTGEGSFRVTKQYYGGRSARVVDLASGRLVAQADEAENFITSLIRGGTSGPAGLLWVRQGITGIEKRSRTEEEGEKQVRQSLLESVQGEVEAVTGGRRMAEIMAAAKEALSDMVTATGRPKAGGRYAAAIEERDRLANDEARLAADVSRLRQALDQRANAAARLIEVDSPSEREERRAAIQKAQSRFDAVKAQNEKLKTAEAELKLVRERRNAAERELKAFIEAQERAAVLQENLASAQSKRTEAITRRREAADTIKKTRDDVERAETEEQELRERLARFDAATKAREAYERLADLKQRLAEAEKVRQSIEESEAQRVLLQISARSIEELQACEVEIAKLRAFDEAARPSVSIHYEAEAAGRVTLDGKPLTDGEDRTYDGQAWLEVEGIGTIILRSNRPGRDDNQLALGEAARTALLASMGVDSLSAARDRQARAQLADGDLRGLRARLSFIAPEGLAKLRQDVATGDAISLEVLDLSEDPTLLSTQLAQAEDRRKQARLALREVEPDQSRADEAFVATETTLTSLLSDRAQVDAILGPEEARAERARSLSTTLTDLDQSLSEAEAHVLKLGADAGDLASIEAALTRARSIEAAVDKEINALRETMAGLNAEIRAQSEEAVEEKWRETSEALTAATARVAAYEKEVAVLQRVTAALENARSEARELYLKPVMAELGPLLRLLFDDVSITFDDRTLLPQTILRNGQEEDVDRLSGGMREQLSILTRLAFARLLARDGRPAPVILDDALVYSDDDRIEKMFDALHRQSRDQQIIVFSCRQRAFQKLGGNVLQMKDWQT